MARTIKPKKQVVAGATYRAPSAPSAPGVRNQQGINAITGSNNLARRNTGPAAGKSMGNLSGNIRKVTPPKAPLVPNAPAAPGGGGAPGPDQRPDPRDSTYWNNVAALQAQYATEYGSNLLAQGQATADYNTEAQRMETDRSRARRNLAESMLGSGGIYSGSHRRTQTEGDQDLLLNRGRLDADYTRANQQRELERADIDRRLKEGTGTDWISELLGATGRAAETALTTAESGEGIYDDTKARLKGANKQVSTLKKKVANAKSPAQKQAAQIKLVKAQKRRQNLARKK